MQRFILGVFLIFQISAGKADPFTIQENRLLYDTENSKKTDEIIFEHVDELLTILRSNSEIDTLVLNSGGGMIAAANEMSDLIIDAGLNTIIEHSCESACVTMFLAGNVRMLEIGAKIGFHKSWWAAKSIEDYYNSEKENEGWQSPFEFASWLYEDTQTEIFSKFEYLLERGVKPDFAIQTLRAGSDGMWYPRRKDLLTGGVLTE